MANFTDIMSAVSREYNTELEQENNYASLVVDELVYDFFYDAETERLLAVAMISDFEAAPSDLNKTLLFKQLLKAQFYFEKTSGFTFGLSDTEDFVSLQALWSISTMTEQELLKTLKDYVETVRTWTEKLEVMCQALGRHREPEDISPIMSSQSLSQIWG